MCVNIYIYIYATQLLKRNCVWKSISWYHEWMQILKRTNNIFELVTNQELSQLKREAPLPLEVPEVDTWKIQLKGVYPINWNTISSISNTWLLMLGQMLYMEDWKMIVFLGTPQMADLDAMTKVGLYINDLSMHDFSR